MLEVHDYRPPDMTTHMTLTQQVFSPQTPIVLVGLMGAGKTTIGRRLASELEIEFIDSDQEIVEAAGCAISDIFEIYGEPVFRDLEKKVITRLLKKTRCVIATGGGVYVNPALRDMIQSKALSIWLKADLDVLLERVSRRDSRPLLKQGDKKEIMEKLMHERYPVYAEADITVESDFGAHEKVVHAVVEAIKVWEQET